MKPKRLKDSDINAYVCEWGDANNPTIVCLHGLGGTNLSFIELAEQLKDKYHLVSIDLAGHGKTPSLINDEDYAMPNLAKWLDKVIRLLALDKFYIMGHSFGAYLALHYSAMYSDKVLKVLLLDGGYVDMKETHHYFKGIDREKLDVKPNLSLEDEFKTNKDYLKSCVFKDFDEFLSGERKDYARYSDLLEKASIDMMKENDDNSVELIVSLDTANSLIKSMYDYPTSKIYAALKMPILLLQSIAPEPWREFNNSQVEVFKNGVRHSVVKQVKESHMLHWDNPDVVVKEIRGFFK